ncbi:hypothetical protein Tco_0328636 [Tanacetum coccineum]
MARTNSQAEIISKEQLVPRANRLVIKKNNERVALDSHITDTMLRFKFGREVPDAMISDAIKKKAVYTYYMAKKVESKKSKIVDKPEEQHVSLVKKDCGNLIDFLKTIYAALIVVKLSEIWLRVQQMMKGSDIGIQEKKAKFTYADGWSNGGNQISTVSWQNVGNQVVQNTVQNQGVQNVGNQNGLIVVPGITNQNPNGNGNVVAARAEGNATGIMVRILQKSKENGQKPDKHGHENGRARKEPGESYQNYFKGPSTRWQGKTSPSTLIGGDPRKNDTVDIKEAQGNRAYTLEVLTKEAQACHNHGLPRWQSV